MTQNKVQIELEVLDNGTARIKKFSSDASQSLAGVSTASNRATSSIQAGWEKLKSAWVGVIASIYAVKQAWDMMQTAAKARQERQAFENMAASYGSSGAKIIEELKRVSAGTIDTMTLVRNAGTAMMLGIAPENISKLMEIARATARQTGQTVTQAFSDISMAVGRQSKMILDNLGIMVSVEKANDDYAKSLGRTASQLTDAERKMAFMNATIKAGEELMGRLGDRVDSVADRLERFNASIQNLKTGVGDVFIRIYQFLEGTATAVSAWAVAVAEGIFRILELSGRLADLIPGISGLAKYWRDLADAASGSKWDLAEKANQAFQDAYASGEKAATGQGVYKKTIDDTTASIKDQASALKKIDDQRKDALNAAKTEADTRRQANQEMFQKSGMDAQAFYADEAAALIEKTAKWEAAGVSITKINEYLYDQFGKMATEAWEKGETASYEYLDTLQAKSDVLITEFEQMQNEALNKLDNIGIKVGELNGSEIALSLTLHDGVSGVVDRVMDKLSALKAATAAAAVSAGQAPAAATSSSPGSANQGVGSAVVYEGNRAVNVYVTEKVSRSDVTNIVTEQQRIGERG